MKAIFIKAVSVLSIVLATVIITANYRPIQEKIHDGIYWITKKNTKLGEALFEINKAIFNGTEFDLERSTKNSIYNAFSNTVMVSTMHKEPSRTNPGGTGTGFFVKIEDNEAWILTNHHVVADAWEDNENWTVTVFTALDMWSYKATIVGVDEVVDVAIIKISKLEDEKWEAVEWEDPKNIGPGNPVTVVGHGMSMPWSSTAGIVTYSGRFGTRPYNLMLQVDAVINQGNSGGPIFGSNGKVYGVSQSILSPARSIPGWDGVGLAVSSEQAQRSMNYIMSPEYVSKGYVPYSEYPFSLGTFKFEDVKDIKKEDRHFAYIDYSNKNEDEPNTLGEDAGLLQGDIILDIDGENIYSSWKILRKTILSMPGDIWNVKVKRGDEELTFTISLREMDRNELLKQFNFNRGR